jgi:hypothetical protein
LTPTSRPQRVSPSMANPAVPCVFLKEPLLVTAMALPRTRVEARTVAFAGTVTLEIAQEKLACLLRRMSSRDEVGVGTRIGAGMYSVENLAAISPLQSTEAWIKSSAGTLDRVWDWQYFEIPRQGGLVRVKRRHRRRSFLNR